MTLKGKIEEFERNFARKTFLERFRKPAKYRRGFFNRLKEMCAEENVVGKQCHGSLRADKRVRAQT